MPLMLLSDYSLHSSLRSYAEFAWKEIPVKATNYVIKRTGTLVNRGPSKRTIKEVLNDVAMRINHAMPGTRRKASAMKNSVQNQLDAAAAQVRSMYYEGVFDTGRALIPQQAPKIDGLNVVQMEDIQKALQHVQLKASQVRGFQSKEMMTVGKITDRGVDFAEPWSNAIDGASPIMGLKQLTKDRNTRDIMRNLGKESSVSIHSHPAARTFSGLEGDLQINTRHNYVLTPSGGVYYFERFDGTALNTPYIRNIMDSYLQKNRGKGLSDSLSALDERTVRGVAQSDATRTKSNFIESYMMFKAQAKALGMNFKESPSPLERKFMKRYPNLEADIEQVASEIKKAIDYERAKAAAMRSGLGGYSFGV